MTKSETLANEVAGMLRLAIYSARKQGATDADLKAALDKAWKAEKKPA